MHRFVLVLAITAALLLRAPVGAVDQVVYPFPDDLSRFSQYVESLRAQAGVPGLAAAIVGSDRLLWEHAFGQQDLERLIAASPSTPFHFNGLTQLFTAAMVLRCVEEGRLSLDDRIGRLRPESPEANATIREVLTHTSGTPENLVFAYKPERIEPVWPFIRACNGASYRQNLMNLFDNLAMIDSVPGPDAIRLSPPAEGVPTVQAVARYKQVLGRLAAPYSVDARRRATPSAYSDTTLTTASGLISTVRDFAQFDLALRGGVLVHSETLAAAWQAPVGAGGKRLPHGLGWFVQVYNGETIAWQFGLDDNAASSLVITVPGRGLTLVLVANSPGLVKPFPLAAGDVTVSPFGRLFLELFVR